MELLAGRRFAIRVLDAGLTLRFRADAQGFHADSADGDADLRLSATLADFARMMLREEDPDTLFFHRKLQIEGDTELGLIVKTCWTAWTGAPRRWRASWPPERRARARLVAGPSLG